MGAEWAVRIEVAEAENRKSVAIAIRVIRAGVAVAVGVDGG